NQHRDMIINLSGLKTLSVELPGEKPKRAATAVVETATIYVLLEGAIDFAKEIKRLDNEMNKLTNELTAVSGKLSNEKFINKAPGDIVENVKEKQRILLEKQGKLKANIEKIKGLRE
ncbi:MAG: valine--tRNA ligase, partial [Desulfobacterales bacterium]|nr:valine--tRNA ligase [Desulfobacterales bacterium]